MGPERFGPPAVKDTIPANIEAVTPPFFLLKQLEDRFDLASNALSSVHAGTELAGNLSSLWRGWPKSDMIVCRSSDATEKHPGTTQLFLSNRIYMIMEVKQIQNE